jgi:hypothetical protein
MANVTLLDTPALRKHISERLIISEMADQTSELALMVIRLTRRIAEREQFGASATPVQRDYDFC